MKTIPTKSRYLLLGLLVILLLVAGISVGRSYLAQQRLKTGNLELVGRIIGVTSNEGEGGVGFGSTTTIAIRTNEGAKVNLAYTTNPSLGPNDPYKINIAPKITTDLSEGKRVWVKGYYFKETNTIALDGEGCYVREAQ